MLGNWSPKTTPDVFTNPNKQFGIQPKFQSKILKENAIDIMAGSYNKCSPRAKKINSLFFLTIKRV